MSERLTDERLSEIRASVLYRAMRPHEFHEPTEALALLAEIDRLRGERRALMLKAWDKGHEWEHPMTGDRENDIDNLLDQREPKPDPTPAEVPNANGR